MEFDTLRDRAIEISKRYKGLELQRYGREWTTEELMLGFVKDVGDLAKYIHAHEGTREVDNLESKLATELSDCLWSIIVLADRLGVDLEKAFMQTMDDIDKKIDKAQVL